MKYKETVIVAAGVVVGDDDTIGDAVADGDDPVGVVVTVTVGAGVDPPQAAKATAASTTAINISVHRVLCGEIMAPHSPFAD
jgi:hypothetical protein